MVVAVVVVAAIASNWLCSSQKVVTSVDNLTNTFLVADLNERVRESCHHCLRLPPTSTVFSLIVVC